MAIDDAVSRLSDIRAQLAALEGRIPPQPPTASPAPADPSATAASAPASFAGALAQAQAPLSAQASGSLTPGQAQFASRLAAQTGLDPQVIAAWVLSEENGSAAASREQARNHNWLNIGYTDSGTHGASNAIWANPDTAADATAGWLKGQDTIAGYGRASAGVQAILGTAGQSPETQIAALQHSGWASGGYPGLPALYQRLSG
jgi:hypothetical protein